MRPATVRRAKEEAEALMAEESPMRTDRGAMSGPPVIELQLGLFCNFLSFFMLMRVCISLAPVHIISG